MATKNYPHQFLDSVENFSDSNGQNRCFGTKGSDRFFETYTIDSVIPKKQKKNWEKFHYVQSFIWGGTAKTKRKNIIAITNRSSGSRTSCFQWNILFSPLECRHLALMIPLRKYLKKLSYIIYWRCLQCRWWVDLL